MFMFRKMVEKLFTIKKLQQQKSSKNKNMRFLVLDYLVIEGTKLYAKGTLSKNKVKSVVIDGSITLNIYKEKSKWRNKRIL